MIVEAQVTINGSKAAVWAAITNIENASKIMSGIENIEVLEKPANGLVGLRWRETRMYFGKPAAVEKRITDAAENKFFNTRAESDGFEFLSSMSISEGNGGVTLTVYSRFEAARYRRKTKVDPYAPVQGHGKEGPSSRPQRY